MIDLTECIEKLSSEQEPDRIYAAEDLGYANQVAGVAALLARLEVEPSAAVKQAIFAALGQIEDESVIEAMIALLDSEDAFVRNQAVEVLRQRDGRIGTYLERAFNEGDADRRKFVVDVLAYMGGTESIGIYQRALADADVNVRISAIESAGAAHRRELKERIEALAIAGAHPMVLSACLEALAEIGDQASVAAIHERFGKHGSIPAYLAPSYVKLVGARGGPEDTGELVDLIHRPGLEEAVVNSLATLRARFPSLCLPAALSGILKQIVAKRESPHLAYHALRLMAGLTPDGEVFTFVGGCLNDPEKAVRIGAAQTLGEWDNAESASLLEAFAHREKDEEILQALSRSGRS